MHVELGQTFCWPHSLKISHLCWWRVTAFRFVHWVVRILTQRLFLLAGSILQTSSEVHEEPGAGVLLLQECIPSFYWMRTDQRNPMSPLLPAGSRYHTSPFHLSLMELFQAQTSTFRIASPFKTEKMLSLKPNFARYYLSFIWLHLDTITLMQQTKSIPWYFTCSKVTFVVF